jgi:hypothetical protein
MIYVGLLRVLMLNACTFLSLVQAIEVSANLLRGETDLVPWVTMLGSLSEFRHLIAFEPFYGKFRVRATPISNATPSPISSVTTSPPQAYALRLLQPMLYSIGWEPQRTDPHPVLLLRSALLEAAVYLEDSQSLQTASGYFNDFVSTDFT